MREIPPAARDRRGSSAFALAFLCVHLQFLHRFRAAARPSVSASGTPEPGAIDLGSENYVRHR
jgi:hypothetical protein